MKIKLFKSGAARARASVIGGVASLACAVTAVWGAAAVGQTATPAKPVASASASSSATTAHTHHAGTAAGGAGASGGHGPMHPPSFDDIDTNHDGTISKAEFDAFRAAHPHPGPGGPDGKGPDGEGFGGDHGHGGWDGPRDFDMHRERMWRHRHEKRDHGGPDHEGPDHEGHGPMFDLKAADTDHDGKISWAEFQAAATTRLKAHFDHMDANHDGFLDATELKPPHDHHDRDGKADDGKADGKNSPPPADTTPAK